MFLRIKKRVINLCKKYELPEPEIVSSLYETIELKCDYTDSKKIVLNIEKAGDLSLEGDQDHYARHVFSHYLCNLEQVPKYSDKVVDLISDWIILKKERYI